MILILIRHGVAADFPDDPGGGDAARPLTDAGRKKLRDVASVLRKLDIKPTHYWSSHRLRAVQTIEEVSSVYTKGSIRITEEPALDIGAEWSELATALTRLYGEAPDSVVVAAGHMPSIAEHFAGALGARATREVNFKKGAAAVIEWKSAPISSNGTLLFFLTAAMARKLV